MIEPFNAEIRNAHDELVEGVSGATVPAPLAEEMPFWAANPPRLLRRRIFEGANAYFSSSVISQSFDLGELSGRSTSFAGADFAWRFMDRFLDCRMRLPDAERPEPFLRRLNSEQGVPFEEALLEAILAVETHMRFVMKDLDLVRFAQWQSDGATGGACVWATNMPGLSRRVPAIAFDGLAEILPQELGVQAERRRQYTRRLNRLELQAKQQERSKTIAILELAARKRGIPTEVLNSPYLRLGEGCRQKTLHSTVAASTSFTATTLARNKTRTIARLAEIGLPVPRHIRVTSLTSAFRAAETLGYPVVVKPTKQRQSRGVTVNVRTPDELRTAFERAAKLGPVLVEVQVPGDVHRLVVVKANLVAALRMELPRITGDGRSTVADLIRRLNDDPMRDGIRLNKVRVDKERRKLIGAAGYELGDVVERDKTLVLGLICNFSGGCYPNDVTASVHADNKEMAVRAAQAIGVEIAGLDFICEDITRSYKNVGGAILEVNARPGLSLPARPGGRWTHEVSVKIMEEAFPEGAPFAVPKVFIAGALGTNAVAQALETILRASGRKVAMLGRRGGAKIDGQAMDLDAPSRAETLRALLRDPQVETLVASISLQAIETTGLGVETSDISCLLEPREGEESYRSGIEILARHTAGAIVVDITNTQALRVLENTPKDRLVLVGAERADEALERHVADGGAGVLCVSDAAGDRIVFLDRDGGSQFASVSVAAASETERRQRLKTLAFAAALASKMGVTRELTEQALSAEFA